MTSSPLSRARMRFMVGITFLVVAVGLLAVRSTAAGAQAARPVTPNAFQLRGQGVSVSYSTTSIDGTPRFSYTSGGRTLNFQGDQISTVDSPMGTLVTVFITATPDLSSTVFTVVIPRINLDPDQVAPVRTQGFTTVERTSIGGPDLVRGQLQTSRVVALSGTARQVFS